MSATAVSFLNRSRQRLVGVVDEPVTRAASDLGVILLSPGVKMRVGPQRMYLTLGDVFTAAGLPVLRFDFTGLGDSEGQLQEGLLRDVYNHIEVGRYVDDTVDAIDWMAAHYGVKRVIVSGLCGGAITGLLAGARDPRIAGLLGIGITPVLASRAADPSKYMTTGQLNQIGQSYLRKLSDPRSWLRLLTFRSDYRLLLRALRSRFGPAPAAPPAAAPPAEDDNANPLFPPAFFAMAGSSRPMMLLFGGGDRLHWEFEEKFVARHRQRLEPLRDRFAVHVVPDANHVLSLSAWQAEMVDVARRWLVQHFSPDLIRQRN